MSETVKDTVLLEDLDSTIETDKDNRYSDATGETMMLTTIDNPFNPKTEYDEWREWDKDNGYNTGEFLARLIDSEKTFDIDDELLLSQRLTEVMYEVLEHDVLNVYVLV